MLRPLSTLTINGNNCFCHNIIGMSQSENYLYSLINVISNLKFNNNLIILSFREYTYLECRERMKLISELTS